MATALGAPERERHLPVLQEGDLAVDDHEDSDFLNELEAELLRGQDEEEFSDARPGPSSHPPPRTSSPHHQHADITSLPFDVLLSVLSTLSALDLASVRATCTSLRHVASEALLWRRLFCLRWGRNEALGAAQESDWRALYAARDREDLRALIQSCGADAMLLELQRADLDAKRLQEPGQAIFSDSETITVFGDGAEAEAIISWRRRANRNEDATRQAQAEGHVCSASCVFDQISDSLFACRGTGIMHRCGAQCDQKRLDPESEGTLLHCWISGRAWQVHEEDEAGVGGTGDEEDEEDGGEEGLEEDELKFSNLKQMFSLGYMSSEKELRQFFGAEYDRPPSIATDRGRRFNEPDPEGD